MKFIEIESQKRVELERCQTNMHLSMAKAKLETISKLERELADSDSEMMKSVVPDGTKDFVRQVETQNQTQYEQPIITDELTKVQRMNCLDPTATELVFRPRLKLLQKQLPWKPN